MFKKKVFKYFAAGVIIASLIAGVSQTPVSANMPAPKNIIIMIGDGMGYNHSLAASYYRFGAARRQVYCDFPVQFAERTSSAGWGYDPTQAWSNFDYVKANPTDSAAAATALATGVKTTNYGAGVDQYGNPVGNVFEAAEAIGRSTGLVTSTPISDGTGAGFAAHNPNRTQYEAISQQIILQSKLDVIMGAGNPGFYGQELPVPFPTLPYMFVGGQATWDALGAGNVQSDVDGDGANETTVLIQDREAFQALMSGATPERVVGVAKAYMGLQLLRFSDSPMTDLPYSIPFNQDVPTLTEMSLAAINVLDNDPDGFVLMIEGGAMDWAGHFGYPGRLIEEQISFDQTVEAVVNWVEMNSNWGETLLIVTGDHETGYLWGPGSNPIWQPVVNNGAGVMPSMQFYARLPQGAPFYANHTNSLIGMYAKGDDARLFKDMIEGIDPVRGAYIDNTSIARVIFTVLAYGH